VSQVTLCYLNAKIRGMRAKLWEGARLESLLDSRDLSDLARRIYPGAQFASALVLERRLTEDHVSALARAALHLEGRQADFVWALLGRYQVENLRTVLRLWSAGETTESASELVASVSGRLALPIEELMSARDIGEFAALVTVEPIKDGIASGMEDYVRTRKPFFLEAGIDKAYFDFLADVHAALSPTDRRATDELVDAEISAYNAMFILRGRFNYGLERAVTEKYLSRSARTVGASVTEALYAAPSLEAACQTLPRRFAGPPGGKNLAEVERAIWKRLFRRANHRYYASMADLGGVQGFYYVKRVELMNLISIAEALRYGLPASEARANLIFLKEAAGVV